MHLEHEILLLVCSHRVRQSLQLFSLCPLVHLIMIMMIIIMVMVINLMIILTMTTVKEKQPIHLYHHDHDDDHLTLHIAELLHPLNLLLASCSKCQCLLLLCLWIMVVVRMMIIMHGHGVNGVNDEVHLDSAQLAGQLADAGLQLRDFVLQLLSARHLGQMRVRGTCLALGFAPLEET